MKNTIFIIILISLLIAIVSIFNYEKKSEKNDKIIIQILKDNEKLQLNIYLLLVEIIDLTTQDTIELGSAEWYPTHDEWTNMSEQEKRNWEEQYDLLNK